jgi:hypothetical protein
MARTASITSGEDENDLMASFKKSATGQMRGRKARSQASGRDSSDREMDHQRMKPPPAKLVAVQVPPVRNRAQYIYYDGQEAVQQIRREFKKGGELIYDIELVDGTHKQVSHLRHAIVPDLSGQLGRQVKVLASFTASNSPVLYPSHMS